MNAPVMTQAEAALHYRLQAVQDMYAVANASPTPPASTSTACWWRSTN